MPTIRENLIAAIAAVAAWPENRFDLETFTGTNECGTFYCSLGLLTTVPHFRKQGLRLRTKERREGASFGVGKEGVEDAQFASQATWPDEMFGMHAFYRLFSGRGDGDLDDAIITDLDLQRGERLSDKELAIARLRWQLENYT